MADPLPGDPVVSDVAERPVPGDADVTRRLLDAGVAIFGQRGFDGSTVAEIARSAGVTTGAIFSRWATKHEMFVAVVDHVCASNSLHLAEVTDLSPVDKFFWLASNLLAPERTGMRNLRVEACVSAARDASMRAAVARSLAREADDLTALLAEGAATGEIDLDFDSNVHAFYCQALTVGVHILRRALEGEQFVPSHDEWRTFAVQMFDYFDMKPSAVSN